jgi:hypothetical protein
VNANKVKVEVRPLGDANSYIITSGQNWIMSVQCNGEQTVAQQEDYLEKVADALTRHLFLSDPNLPPYQHRVVIEKCELDVKIMNLNAFFASEKFNDLNAVNAQILLRQLNAMIAYSQALALRIEDFNSQVQS